MEAAGISFLLCIFCGTKKPLSNCSGDEQRLSVDTLHKLEEQCGFSYRTYPSEVVLCKECLAGAVRTTQWGEAVAVMKHQHKIFQDNHDAEMRRLVSRFRLPGIDLVDATRQGILNAVSEFGGFQDGISTHYASNIPPPPVAAERITFANSSEPNSQILLSQPQNVLLLQTQQLGNAIQPEVEFQRVDDPAQHALLNTGNIGIEHVTSVNREPQRVSNRQEFSFTGASSSSLKKTNQKAGFRTFYTCGFCGSTFKSSSSLKEHVYTHTGERPYKCPLCPSDFAQQGSLDRHLMRRHREMKPFPCPSCDERFECKAALREHKFTHFGMPGARIILTSQQP